MKLVDLSFSNIETAGAGAVHTLPNIKNLLVVGKKFTPLVFILRYFGNNFESFSQYLCDLKCKTLIFKQFYLAELKV